MEVLKLSILSITVWEVKLILFNGEIINEEVLSL